MRAKILSAGWTSGTRPPATKNKLRLHKIEIINSRSYPDCAVIERHKFYFRASDKNGWMFPGDCRFLIVMDIYTGYIPDDVVDSALRQQLSRFPILFIEEIVQAFRYRCFYLNI